MFGQDCTCPALLEDRGAARPYGAVTRCGPPFQAVPVRRPSATGLVRLRSPLLTESRLMSFPPGTEMFQFPGLAPSRVPPSRGAGCPIRKSAGHSAFAALRGLSQRITSFVASQRPGIHQMLLRHLTAPTADARKATSGGSVQLCFSSSPVRTGAVRPAAGRGKPPAPPETAPGPRPQRPPPIDRGAGPGQAFYQRFKQRRPGKRPRAAKPNHSPPRPAGGARRDRTDDLMLAKHALSQLSYGPNPPAAPPGTRSGGPGWT